MKWKSVSASQFKTYALCKRKWHIERFSGLPRPPSSPAQELGTEVHRILENYLRHGASFPETVAGRIAERGKPFLPEPGTGEVEGKITLTSIDPPLIGFIDLYVDGVTPEVVDHKTLGSWKWARTEEELGTDLQMIPYAVHALEKTGAASVRVTHLQYLTKGAPETREVSAVLQGPYVYEEWEKTKGTCPGNEANCGDRRTQGCRALLERLWRLWGLSLPRYLWGFARRRTQPF